MKKRFLAGTLEVSALGLGCMGMSEFYGPGDDENSIKIMHHAVDRGITFFDTSDTYGTGHNEELIGRFLKESPEVPVIATKFGIVRNPGEYARGLDNSPAYVKSACEASLKRLGVDCIDLYYVHRVNPAQPIEETMAALGELVQEGKIKHIGLCEVSAQTLRKAHAVHPVTALQTEYSLWTRDVEDEILPACRELGVGFVPYSPLGRGFLTGTFSKNMEYEKGDARGFLPRFSEANIEANLKIVEDIQSIAADKECTSAQVALAWLLAQGEDIVPIPGTRRIKYLEENIASVEVELTKGDLGRIEKVIQDNPVVGERYPEEGMKGVNV